MSFDIECNCYNDIKIGGIVPDKGCDNRGGEPFNLRDEEIKILNCEWFKLPDGDITIIMSRKVNFVFVNKDLSVTRFNKTLCNDFSINKHIKYRNKRYRIIEHVIGFKEVVIGKQIGE